MYRYVLTGGHGVGKTALILAIQLSGETVIRESASDYMYVEYARGNRFPLDHTFAENNILAIQLAREEAISQKNERVFLDRSVIDHFAYARLLKQPLDNLLTARCSVFHYDLVFEVNPLDSYGIGLCTARERAYSKKVSKYICDEYENQGYSLISVPQGTLDNRCAFIMKKIEIYESGR